MIKIIVISIVCFTFTSTLQAQHELSTYLSTQYNTTLYDKTKGNPWSIGLGLHAFLNNKTKFKPALEFTGDLYLEDDKVFRLNSDGSVPTEDNTVRSMVNLFVGSSYNPSQNIYVSFVAGPSFISGQTLPGIKPSVGFYFSKNQKWKIEISFINIFNRGNTDRQNFSSLSFSLGHKLF